MKKRRALRTCAVQMLYQLDARSQEDADEILRSTQAHTEDIGLHESEIEKAWDLARAAYRSRRAADTEVVGHAPQWPSARQPAMDRAILRLAHYEMTAGTVPPKVAVNEAVELAKVFGSEKSPAFVNGILDKILKRVLAEQRVAAEESG